VATVELTKKEREELEHYVDKITTAEVAFEHATRMLQDAQNGLWERIREIHQPEPLRMTYRADEPWTFTIKD
jgi:hypothetical protein